MSLKYLYLTRRSHFSFATLTSITDTLDSTQTNKSKRHIQTINELYRIIMDPKHQPATVSNAKLNAGPTSREDLEEQVQSTKALNIVDLPTEIVEQIAENLRVEVFKSRYRDKSRDALLDFRLSHTKLAAQSQRIFFKRYFKTIRVYGMFPRGRSWDRLCHLSKHDVIPISADKLDLAFLRPNVGLKDKDTGHELKSVLERFTTLKELYIGHFNPSCPGTG